MATFTVWKFDDPEGATRAAATLKETGSEHLVTVVDHATVSWPAGADKPSTHHSHEDEKRGTGWGAFWGLLFGVLFFVPLLGAAVGAAVGGITRATAGVGIDADQIERIRAGITPGTSALFAVTENGDLDRVGERFHGFQGTLVATNLTPAERATLLETFG
ncbi:DUF1269 domain-containing protein [Cellulomonas sp. PhB143]|uniref:DUF1269 domain-containing protein n=1 Tax=Cellulomonas sp. PhB143 TaxID=2485186 RepID=UPI000F46AAC6|nr:DUF1269 domain-containing protein [Cellulomonas sp. PhB143]ROS75412.1 putative membrane protein [Cellulomonas sp. PhB143]